jgi:hypothetical protein
MLRVEISIPTTTKKLFWLQKIFGFGKKKKICCFFDIGIRGDDRTFSNFFFP